MPLPMQSDELLPGQQNIGSRRLRARAPNRRGGDGALDSLEQFGKTAPGQFGGEGGPFGFRVRAAFFAEIVGEMMGKDVDQGAFELLRIGVAELGGGEFFEMIVQKPRVINRRLEDEGFPALDRSAMAAMNRARGQLRARGDIGRLGSAGQACRNGAAQSHSASKLPAAVRAGHPLRKGPARRAGVSNGPVSLSRVHSTCASGRAAARTSSIAARPPERARSSGSWPSGSAANFRLLPGLSSGKARSTAR